MKYILFALLVLVAPFALAETRLFGDAPLIEAIKSDDLEGVKSALLENPNANQTLNGTPVLLMAAEQASSEILSLLLSYKADINKTDRQGMTALMVAAAAGNDAALGVLIKAGASLEKISRAGMTALMYAAQDGHHECVKQLLAAGANKKVADFTGRTALDWAQDSRNQPTLELLD
jgi:ankyrin repeat protein